MTKSMQQSRQTRVLNTLSRIHRVGINIHVCTFKHSSSSNRGTARWILRFTKFSLNSILINVQKYPNIRFHCTVVCTLFTHMYAQHYTCMYKGMNVRMLM
jgi:hypothetical protein